MSVVTTESLTVNSHQEIESISTTETVGGIVPVVTSESLTVNSHQEIECISTAETVAIVPVDFLFRNRSFPRDDVIDILPHSEKVARKTSSRKQNTKILSFDIKRSV